MAKRLLILSFKEFAKKQQRYFQLLWTEGKVDIHVLSRSFFDDQPVTNVIGLEQLFERISEKLDEYAPDLLKSLTVLLPLQIELPEETGSNAWNPLLFYEDKRNHQHPRTVLFSWLILCYPEVQWGFLAEKQLFKKDTKQPLMDAFTLLPGPNIEDKLSGIQYTSLFDPWGLRSNIRNSILNPQNENKSPTVSHIPIRKYFSAAIDEEESYAYLYAYTAYRFGFNALCITNWRNMEYIFGKEKSDSTAPKIDIVLEDLYLNFSDRPDFRKNDKTTPENRKRLSYLKFRDLVLPLLKLVKLRIIITVGHKGYGDSVEIWEGNRTYLKELGIKTKLFYKPFGGIFDLWKKTGMWNKRTKLPKLANDFLWPPKHGDAKNLLQVHDAHSAPGRLLAISQKLIVRAGKILQDTRSVPDVVHAAILALEAKELLGGRTPTTALEALSLQHHAEITAESMFYGVEYNLKLKDRFKDIEREVKAISLWFNPRTRKRSELNARLSIIENLAKHFRNLNQFEEEHGCLAEARKLRFAFWVRQSPWHWILAPALKYIEIAMYSLHRFILIVIGWVIIFAFFYYLFALSLKPEYLFAFNLKEQFGPLDAFWASTASFFSTYTPQEWVAAMSSEKPFRWLWNAMITFQGIVSFTNLGLLISHIYMIVSRR